MFVRNTILQFIYKIKSTYMAQKLLDDMIQDYVKILLREFLPKIFLDYLNFQYAQIQYTSDLTTWDCLVQCQDLST